MDMTDFLGLDLENMSDEEIQKYILHIRNNRRMHETTVAKKARAKHSRLKGLANKLTPDQIRQLRVALGMEDTDEQDSD